MKRNTASKWIGFWRDLKAGYDLFEKTREVPVAAVMNGRYILFSYARRLGVKDARLITAWR